MPRHCPIPEKAVSLRRAIKWLGTCDCVKYIVEYLKALGATTVFSEKNYIDEGFLTDYIKFYARYFDAPERFTTRLHFFSKKFDFKNFRKNLINNDESFIKEVRKEYLGFLVIKPIRNEFLIGRTVLKPYPKRPKRISYFLAPKHTLSLYGTPIEMHALPYQTQDRAVAACATAALWISSYALSEVFGTPLYSLAEITEIASKYPEEWRIFPSEGLSLQQIINFIRFIGLDLEFIRILPGKEQIILDIIKAYIGAKLPIIAGVGLKRQVKRKGEEPVVDLHAVVISGYCCNLPKNTVEELYVHDDQIGPYTKVIQKKGLGLIGKVHGQRIMDVKSKLLRNLSSLHIQKSNCLSVGFIPSIWN